MSTEPAARRPLPYQPGVVPSSPAPLPGLRRLGRDLRALGWRAPVRGAAEVWQRTGAADAVLRRLPSPPPGPCRSALPGLPAPRPHDAVLARLAADVARILGGEVRLFDRWWRVPSGPGRWCTDPSTGACWPEAPSRTLHFEGPLAPADPKWAWELGRHRHVVLLARGAAVGIDPTRCVEALHAELSGFLDACPPEHGIQWASSLELALRSVAWVEALALAGPMLDDDLCRRLGTTLWHTGRHLLVAAPRTLAMQLNNHLLGDAVGLAAIATSFPGSATARRWRWLADRAIVGFLGGGRLPDGTTIEDSVGYQRFVLELLVTRLRLPDPPPAVGLAVGDLAVALTRMGAGVDPGIPQYGDWDGGRVLATSQPDTGLRGSVRLGLALAGMTQQEELAVWAVEDDECAWYAGTPRGGTARPEGGVAGPRGPSARDDGGPAVAGLARAALDPWIVTLKGAGGSSHAHADLASVAIAHGGRWVVGDPGTGHYNNPLDERQWFRSTAAHATLSIDGEDQLVPDRQFRFRHRAGAVVGEPFAAPVGGPTTTVLWCVHDAYARLDPPRRVVRLVVLEAASVSVVDVIEHPAGARPAGWTSAIALAPGWTVDGDALVDAAAGRRWSWAGGGATRAVVRGGPIAGGAHWSATYGATTPSERIELAGRGPIAWWSVASSADPGASPRLEPHLGIASPERPGSGGIEVAVGPVVGRVRFEPDEVAVELAVGGDGAPVQVRRAATGRRR